MDINLIPLAARFESRGTQFARISRTERERVEFHAADFAVRDAKGREIGHQYKIYREFHVIDADANLLCELDRLDLRLEESFIVEPHGLRNGAKFGALPVASFKRFRTMAEARAYAEQVMTRARKAAAKKASA
jgi:hypothetical protein